MTATDTQPRIAPDPGNFHEELGSPCERHDAPLGNAVSTEHAAVHVS